ncbi:unnamed protein product [Vitrella brassicaformis CCMP3155]|uniref:Uncharacterized protein n=4 Tax=Vitrella brassicaformis TaxID=1169539 RepID=A0A0G4ED90_VITBC|nr:unnamed protein product [Vitrella brassicaformis CCMP3155]|eukprot:CEL93315.1 unnamed protein product [Vitrella brassicaformis CCMP3155]
MDTLSAGSLSGNSSSPPLFPSTEPLFAGLDDHTLPPPPPPPFADDGNNFSPLFPRHPSDSIIGGLQPFSLDRSNGGSPPNMRGAAMDDDGSVLPMMADVEGDRRAAGRHASAPVMGELSEQARRDEEAAFWEMRKRMFEASTNGGSQPPHPSHRKEMGLVHRPRFLSMDSRTSPLPTVRESVVAEASPSPSPPFQQETAAGSSEGALDAMRRQLSDLQSQLRDVQLRMGGGGGGETDAIEKQLLTLEQALNVSRQALPSSADLESLHSITASMFQEGIVRQQKRHFSLPWGSQIGGQKGILLNRGPGIDSAPPLPAPFMSSEPSGYPGEGTEGGEPSQPGAHKRSSAAGNEGPPLKRVCEGEEPGPSSASPGDMDDDQPRSSEPSDESAAAQGRRRNVRRPSIKKGMPATGGAAATDSRPFLSVPVATRRSKRWGSSSEEQLKQEAAQRGLLVPEGAAAGGEATGGEGTAEGMLPCQLYARSRGVRHSQDPQLPCQCQLCARWRRAVQEEADRQLSVIKSDLNAKTKTLQELQSQLGADMARTQRLMSVIKTLRMFTLPAYASRADQLLAVVMPPALTPIPESAEMPPPAAAQIVPPHPPTGAPPFPPPPGGPCPPFTPPPPSVVQFPGGSVVPGRAASAFIPPPGPAVSPATAPVLSGAFQMPPAQRPPPSSHSHVGGPLGVARPLHPLLSKALPFLAGEAPSGEGNGVGIRSGRRHTSLPPGTLGGGAEGREGMSE